MTNIIQQLEAEQAAKIEAKRTLPDFSPGDTLRVEAEIVELRPSRSRPEMGSTHNRLTVFNQHDEPVMTMLSIGLVRTRPTA